MRPRFILAVCALCLAALVASPAAGAGMRTAAGTFDTTCFPGDATAGCATPATTKRRPHFVSQDRLVVRGRREWVWFVAIAALALVAITSLAWLTRRRYGRS